MTRNIPCPKCGKMQKNLDLEETNGRFICSECQAEVQVKEDGVSTEILKNERLKNVTKKASECR